MSVVKVKNINDTSAERYKKPKDGSKSWKEFWEKNSKLGKTFKELTVCAANGCNNKATDGAHVIKEGRLVNKDGHWYIVPLCSECNNPNNEEYFNVNENLLVRVTEN